MSADGSSQFVSEFHAAGKFGYGKPRL
jgi:hypothetical protein